MKKVWSGLCVLLLVLPLLFQSFSTLASDVVRQKKRLAQLEEQYVAGEIAPVRESDFFDGDLQKVLDDGTRYDALSFLATHNSYQTRSVSSYVHACNALSEIIPDLIQPGSGTLDQETLTDQLNVGIRSMELDVEASRVFGNTRFLCMHSPVIDMSTNAYDLSLALREIALWSDNNPDHLPITLILEPKVKFVPMASLRFFNLEYANALDVVLRESLGDKLFTPADMLREYENFSEMRRADDWCKVRDMLGKVLVLFHYDWSEKGEILNAYMAQDESFRTQAMFPLHVDSSLLNACFLAFNDPATILSLQDSLKAHHFVMRTRVDEHPLYSDERREQAMESAAQILTTDYPPRFRDEAYTVSFGAGKTVRLAR